MNTDTLLRQAVKGALALGTGGAMVGAGAALAQTIAPASATATATATQLSRIIVTGTHIPRTSIATAQPIVTINRQQIEATGFTTTGQLLQNMTSTGAALNTQFNNGGNGSVFIDLHDLGSQRVLVLVNGQRWVSTLANAVDLTSIPLAAVDHVDVLLDGASAIYGSDAIAGVINIITVKNYNGATASAYLGMYDGHGDGGGWDGKTQNYSFTVGTSGDRSGVLLSAGYYQQSQVWAGQRWISKEPFVQGGPQSGSGNTPTGRFFLGSLDPEATPPDFFGCSSQGFLGYPGCDVEGPLIGPNADPHPFGTRNSDHYNFAPQNLLLTPSERWYIYSQGHYDLTDNITFDFVTTYNDRISHQTLAANPWVLGAAGYTTNGAPIGISATNPFNPFGVDLIPAVGTTSVSNAWCSKYGTGGGGTCTPGALNLLVLGFRPVNASWRIFNQDSQTFYFNGGFRGYWQMFGNQWTWDAHYDYANTTVTGTRDGLANTSALQTALGPPSGCSGSCVPLNVFGGASQITPAMYNYVFFTAHRVTQQTLRDYNANIGGSFFNGWYAGPWGVAAGYEYDELDGSFSPDALVSTGNTVGNIATPTQGREKTDAEYLELNVPLAENLPLAKSLSVDLANRWSQFTWNGIGNIFHPGPPPSVTTGPATGRAHSSTGRVSLKWQPVDQLLVRGSWSEGFRIPSISELFGGIGTGFPGISDPCAPGPFGGWDGNPADLPAGCHGLVHSQTSGQLQSGATFGGSPNLQPERSIQRAVGFVYSPSWAPGLDVSLDYFGIELEGFIAASPVQFYFNQCYLKQNAEACTHIDLVGNTVSNVIALTANQSTLKVRGFDSNWTYRLPTTPVGNFVVSLDMNFIRNNIVCNTLGQCADLAGSAGGFTAIPKHRYNLGLNWSFGPWAAQWNMYLIGPQWENCDVVSGLPPSGPGEPLGAWCSDPNKGSANGPGPVGQNHLGTTVYNDVQGSYTVASWNTTFSAGIQNLFAKEPPISRTAFANSMLPTVGYRIPGRFFYGKVTVNF